MRRPDAEAGARGAWIAGLAVTVIAVVVSLQVPLLGGLWNDDGVYLVLGRALAAGQGYHAIHIPGEPFHVKFPPGWPLVLSVFWAMSRRLATVLLLARTWNVLAVGATAALLWRLACGQRRLPPMLVVAFAIMPLLLDANLELAAIPTSEPTFLLLWVLSLVLWNDAFSVPEGERNGRNVVAFGFAAGATALVRGPGVVVAGSALVALASVGGPRRPRLVAACATLLPPLLWTGYAFLAAKGQPLSGIPDDRSYQTYLIALVRDGGIPGAIDQLSDNASEVWRTAIYHAAGSELVGAVLVTCFILGALLSLVRLAPRDPFFCLAVVGILFLVLAWPFPQFRLLLPVAPLLGVAAASAVAPLEGRLRARGRFAMQAVVAIGIAVVAWRQVTVHVQGVRSALSGRGVPVMSPAYVLRVNARMLAQLVPWVERHTVVDDRLMTPLASAVFLQTGRRAVPADVAGIGGASSAERYLLDRITKDRLAWLVTTETAPVGGAVVRALGQQCPGLLTRPDSLQGIVIYAVAASTACAVSP